MISCHIMHHSLMQGVVQKTFVRVWRRIATLWEAEYQVALFLEKLTDSVTEDGDKLLST